MRLFPVDLVVGGPGYVLTDSIFAIIPAPSDRNQCLLYCISFPEGLAIRGTAPEICELWHVCIERLMTGEVIESEEDEEDEDEEEDEEDEDEEEEAPPIGNEGTPPCVLI